MKLVMVMPAHNEEQTVGGAVRKCRKYGKVVVVDDASTDKTAQLAKKAGATVITHKVNRGLGGALRTGFAAALKTDSDVVITIDADGQHRPEEVPLFIKKIEEGYDFVLGARDLSNYPRIKKFGNFFLNGMTNFISGTHLKDTESGFRAFKKSALAKLDLKAERYEIAAEIVKEAGRNKLKSANVPITIPIYVKGVGVADGIRNFLYILRK